MKKITMQSIADLAGVSRATVDKVIHNRPGVSDEVREKIRGIILETNYQPVQIRKFAHKETQKRMAVIMPKLQDSFFYDMKQGMDEAAARLRADGLKMDYYFCTDFEPQQILSILDYLKDTQINGIALRGLLNKTIIDRVNEFIDRGIPGCQITGTWQQNCHFDRLQLCYFMRKQDQRIYLLPFKARSHY
ncbi:MAG: LacI family transcriptional regulator [Lachnospiraceae bacterium]|jgi:LacI family transcriptional regulator|nr:LacI family transcriptional regulator [Lachnospiraceae bacterium]